VNNVEVNISLSGRLFGYGKITILTGNDREGIEFNGINRPKELRRLIEARVAKNRQVQKTAAPSIADELEKLAKLKERGIITKAEFEAKKKQILDL
jgi:hypothetical protein